MPAWLSKLRAGATELDLTGAILPPTLPAASPPRVLALRERAPTPPPPFPHAGKNIGAEGGKELAAALHVNTTLTTLNLWGAIRPPPVGSHAAAPPPSCACAARACADPAPALSHADNRIGQSVNATVVQLLNRNKGRAMVSSIPACSIHPISPSSIHHPHIPSGSHLIPCLPSSHARFRPPYPIPPDPKYVNTM